MAGYDGAVDAWLLGEDPYRAAMAAISRAVDAEKQHHGLGTHGRDHAARYHRYWRTPRDDDFTEGVLERLALQQVWDQMPGPHKITLTQLVLADGDITTAAESAGVSYSTYADRLAVARRWARRLWHAPDPPSKHYARRGRRLPGTTAARLWSGWRSARRARRRDAA
jgi:hypothetical protein